MSLNQVIQSCKEISEELKRKLDDIPKNKSCKHSQFPERMWCSERKIMAMYAICENCWKYKSRYNKNDN